LFPLQIGATVSLLRAARYSGAIMQILYARDRVSVPWKNGGGVTSEVAAHPVGAGFDSFGWRVSIARVEQGGPFSTFPNIDRRIALFEGSMALTIAGLGVSELSAASDPLTFRGDAPTEAALIEGPVTDLNIMTRRGVFISQMERRVVRGTLRFNPAAVTFVFPLAPVTAGDALLTRGDAILVESADEAAVTLSAPVECYWVEIAPA
jgi:uncharacterized protein